MTLKVIGAGFGRTGTWSISNALGRLGLPCYHMMDLLFDPARKPDMDFWAEVAASPPGTQHDWERVFGSFGATVDYPGCTVWRELIAAYPEAKVLMTLHPKGPEAWYESTIKTIYGGTNQDSFSVFGGKFNTMMDELVWKRLLQGTMDDPARAVARYNQHIEDVRAAVPADRFLAFSADMGWGPLCEFLGLPVPDEPFPNVNNREVMQTKLDRLARLKSMRAQSAGH